MKNEVNLLDIKKVHPHPLNPRTSLGSTDLDELTESIKAQGVLQPITVVKAADMAEGEYYVVMGHRRLAAAKKAKLNTIPAVIKQMSDQDVIYAMLGENIVRRGLNAAEEAAGFQTALNLGESEASVAEKSGFSTKTIQRRKKLTKLDKVNFEKAASKGVPLGTFEKIANIEDEGLRQRALSAAGTKEFESEYQQVLGIEKRKRDRAAAIPNLSKFAKQVEGSGDKVYYKWLNYNEAAKPDFVLADNACDPGLPEDTALPEGQMRYYFYDNGAGFNVYRDRCRKDDDADAAIAEREAADKAMKQKIRDLNALTANIRAKFISGVTETTCSTYMKEIVGKLSSQFRDTYVSLNKRDINVRLKRYTKNGFADVEALQEKSPAKALFMIVCALLDSQFGENSGSNVYVDRDYEYDRTTGTGEYKIRLQKATKLDSLYDLLESLGYEISEVEAQVKDGTHPIYDAVADPAPAAAVAAAAAEDDGDAETDEIVICGMKALLKEVGIEEITDFLDDNPDTAATRLHALCGDGRTVGYELDGESYTVVTYSLGVAFETGDVFEWDAFIDAIDEAIEYGYFDEVEPTAEAMQAAEAGDETPVAETAQASDAGETVQTEGDDFIAAAPAIMEVKDIDSLNDVDCGYLIAAVRKLYDSFNMWPKHVALIDSGADLADAAEIMADTLSGKFTLFATGNPTFNGDTVAADENGVTVTKENGAGFHLNWEDFAGAVTSLTETGCFQEELDSAFARDADCMDNGDWSCDSSDDWSYGDVG